MSTTGESFRDRHYTIVRGLVQDPDLGFLSGYVLNAVNRGAVRFGDPLVPSAAASYGDPVMETLLKKLAPRIEAEVNLSLYPTYSYFRVYRHGDRLPRHRDRPACEISVTLCLGYQPEEAWPFWTEINGVTSYTLLSKGDALVYRGTEVYHWREEFAGIYAIQTFLHYVDQNGPYNEWKFDRRKSLRFN